MVCIEEAVARTHAGQVLAIKFNTVQFMARLKISPTTKYIVIFNGFCCDTGYFTRYWQYDSFAEAQETLESWQEDVDNSSVGWSDGPESMNIVTIEQFMKLDDDMYGDY